MTEYGQHCLWRSTHASDDAQARELAARLEHRAKADDEVAARDAYLTLLGVAPGERVLEVGCGSGAITRAIATRVGPTGHAVGLDQSPALLAIASELATSAGLADRIVFKVGDARRLPFEDACFDAVLAVTVLSHVPSGESAIPEFVRVVRPGGRVGIFDFDVDMSIFTHPDRVLTRRIVSAASDQTAMNSWLARQTPALLTKAGLQHVKVRGFFPIETEVKSFYGGLASRYADVAVTCGAITDDERRGWLDAFRSAGQEGPIVAGRLHLFVWGRRPA